MSILQIKNVPDELKAKLAERAREEGKTMSALVIDFMWAELSIPSMRAWVERSRQEMKDVPLIDVDTAALIREDRDEREAQLTARFFEHS